MISAENQSCCITLPSSVSGIFLLDMKKLLYNVCKKCQKPLPEGYKHKKCESRRNAQVQCVKNGLKVAAGVAGAVASFAVVIVTKGKVNPKK